MDKIPKPIIIAFREVLMAYYKGGCYDPIVADSPVHIMTPNMQFQQYQYQREQAAFAGEKLLVLHNVPIAYLSKNPMTLRWNMQAVGRSKPLRMVYKEVGKFMADYLGGVQVSEDGKMSTISKDDSHLIADENVRLNTKDRMEMPDGYIRLREMLTTHGF